MGGRVHARGRRRAFGEPFDRVLRALVRLVDWDWAFPFPVPVELVRWVKARHTAEYLQPLRRALASPQLPCVVLFDDVLVPGRWPADADLAEPPARRLLAWECAFQDWLHTVHGPLADHVVHPAPRRVTFPRR